jgi:hypothetical protein
MTMTSMVLTAVVAALKGFAAGLFTFKVKTKRCQDCGTTPTCPACAQPGVHGPRRARS